MTIDLNLLACERLSDVILFGSLLKFRRNYCLSLQSRRISPSNNQATSKQSNPDYSDFKDRDSSFLRNIGKFLLHCTDNTLLICLQCTALSISSSRIWRLVGHLISAHVALCNNQAMKRKFPSGAVILNLSLWDTWDFGVADFYCCHSQFSSPSEL
jgi:hypothetical protein